MRENPLLTSHNGPVLRYCGTRPGAVTSHGGWEGAPGLSMPAADAASVADTEQVAVLHAASVPAERERQPDLGTPVGHGDLDGRMDRPISGQLVDRQGLALAGRPARDLHLERCVADRVWAVVD